MGLSDIAALMRRHLLAVLAVLVLAAGAGYDIRKSPPIYAESATVVFAVKKSLIWSNSHTTPAKPLITTEVMMAQTLMTSPTRFRVGTAGGTAMFDLAPFNTYNLQFPNYAEPVATVTATSPSPAAALRTFTLVLRFLRQRLAAMQAHVGVPPRNRIWTYLVGRTGPVTQPGSPARVFAGLGLLSVVAVFMVSNFLDRRRRERRRPSRSLAATARHTGGSRAKRS